MIAHHRPAGLDVLIDHWVTAGIVSPAQAERLRADPGPFVPVPREPTSLVVEALGYLGGVIIVVASGVLTARYWADLSTAVRLTIVAAAAGLLLAGGIAVPQRLGAAGRRLRAVLLLMSTAGVSAFLALLAHEMLDWRDEDVTLLTGAGTAAYAGILWWRWRTIVQQIATAAALMVIAGAVTAELYRGDHLPGVAVWGVGVLWFLLAWRGLVRPRRVASVVGAAGALVGAAITLPTDPGVVLALVTVAALTAAAVRLRDLVLLAVSAFGALQTLPAAISVWFPDQVSAALVLLAIGAVLVVAAVYTARRRATR